MKKFYPELGILFTEDKNTSDHLVWLIMAIIRNELSHLAKPENAVNSVTVRSSIPNNNLGYFYEAPKAVVINMEAHIESAMKKVQYSDNCFSFTWLLLAEIIDTVAHECNHAAECVIADKWLPHNETEPEYEMRAIDAGTEALKTTAEFLDVNITSFGKQIDEALHALFSDFSSGGKLEPWEASQLHMMKEGIHFFNPANDVSISTLRGVFEAFNNSDEAWVSEENVLFNKFVSVDGSVLVSDSNKETPSSSPAETLTSKPSEQVPPAIAEKAQDKQVETNQITNYDPADEGFDYSTQNDTYNVIVQDINGNPVETNETSQVHSYETTAIDQPEPLAPTEQNIDVLKVQNAVEQVLRRLFVHVATKCEQNTVGGFNNPGAVLEPVDISDIPNHEIFIQQDTVDINGVFSSHAQVNGAIKGKLGKTGLPQYSLYLDIGGNRVHRVFSPANPEGAGKWARAVQGGDRIMYLLNADDKGAGNKITLDMKLPAGGVLGQESFNLWANK